MWIFTMRQSRLMCVSCGGFCWCQSCSVWCALWGCLPVICSSILCFVMFLFFFWTGFVDILKKWCHVNFWTLTEEVTTELSRFWKSINWTGNPLVSALCPRGRKKCQRDGCPVAHGAVVLNGEDVRVEGQTRGACICLAVTQKCLAFHTTPLGTLAPTQPKVYEKQSERGGRGATRKERKARRRVRVMERKPEEKNELDDMRRQGER